jgi:hypothetical protein
MGSYKRILMHNFHELSRGQKLRYYLTDRLFFSRDDRFFFEGSKGNAGQMFFAERRALYQTILKYRPRHCFEVGTFMGGGSTYFLASAFHKLGSGRVISMENEASYHEFAKQFYEKHLRHLLPFVEFLNSSRVEDFTPYIENGVDCFFLDGPEDAEQTIEQYRFFETFCRTGTILMAHDWNTEKMEKLQPLLLESGSRWRLEAELAEPESVGFVVMVRQ